ncbi:adenylylsulfate kinase ApsK [Aequorivita sublithincola DSM 14238]|uniref:Adenylyl-sulfate kinase n=1 Tax=Aequorivita sublithincola (strain DSM 14238 / LMG 21431 / ACAM 643 / 9-3) TaxID=746697 RepID=I3YZG1_AEQSU|nr:adenylyl-sulfate kinase [Aequorivita sublithincola]AFL82379.1 adenylylsulfate kinase ApsK [Aequorivita sublithincola DSM 14238]
MEENVIRHDFSISKIQRSELKKQKPMLLWFTGLSGSGKSTIADAVEMALFERGIHTYLLDGDNVRKGLNNNLSFSPEDRTENIRRIAEVANLMIDAGLVVLASFVSPYREDRENVKRIVGYNNFVEVFVNTPIEECEKRDTKGLYAKARAGEIKNFTGVNAPYEAPMIPDIEIDTTVVSVDEAVLVIMGVIAKKI